MTNAPTHTIFHKCLEKWYVSIPELTNCWYSPLSWCNSSLKKNSINFCPGVYMALITWMDHLTEALGRGEAVIGLFLDFFKAFDTVDHEILLISCTIVESEEKWAIGLEIISPTEPSVYYMMVFHLNYCPLDVEFPRHQFWDHCYFWLYVNDLPNAATNLFSVLYPDDTNMFASGKDMNNLVSNLNSTLLTVSDWLKANKLSINVKKTHCMVWYPRSFTVDRSLPLEFNGQ